MLFLLLICSIFLIFMFGVGVSMVMMLCALVGTVLLSFGLLSFGVLFMPVSTLMVLGILFFTFFMFGACKKESVEKYYLVIVFLCSGYVLFQLFSSSVYVDNFAGSYVEQCCFHGEEEILIIIALIVAAALLLPNHRNNSNHRGQ